MVDEKNIPKRRRTASKLLAECENVLWKFESLGDDMRSCSRTQTPDSESSSNDESSESHSEESLHSSNGGFSPTRQNAEVLTSTDMTTMLGELFDCIEEVSKSSETNEATLARLMKLIGVLIIRVPKPHFLNRLFRLCYVSPRMIFLVSRCFRSMFEESHFEPGETLVFPQCRLGPDQVDSHSAFLSSFEQRAAGSFILDGSLRIFISHGLTVSTWIKLTSSRFDTKQHVISIGCRSLRIAVEVCPYSYSLRVAIMSNGTIIVKKLFPNLLKINGQWVNLVLGLQYANRELKSFIMVGNHHHIYTKQQRLSVKSDANLHISVGCHLPCDAAEVCVYRISTVFGFKGLLSSECGVMLRSLGSACFSLTECRLSQKYSSFVHCLGKPVITSKYCDAADLCDESATFLSRLQRSLLFTWRPSSADSYSLNILQKGVDYISFVDISDSTLCLTMSRDLPVYWVSTIVQERCETVDKSIRTIGSMKVFLFLYALSVEMNATIETQAEAFHLLFVCLKRDPSYFEIFNELDGPLILVRILSSRFAKMNLEMCQDILLYAFNKLEYCNDNELYVSPRTAIIAPDFLKTMLCSADIWAGKRFQYWTRIMFVISESVSESVPEPFRTFNKRRLSNVQFLHQILLTLLEMEMHQTQSVNFQSTVGSILRRPNSALSKSRPSAADTSATRIATTMKNLVTELIGSPFRPTGVTQLWDFILLSHPAHDTYFDYSTRCHNEWMSEELLGLGEQPEIKGPFELSKFFEDLLQEYGTHGIKRMWYESGHNVIKMRNSVLKVVDSSSPSADMSPETTSTLRACRMNSVSNPPIKPDELIKSEQLSTSYSEPPETDQWLMEVRAELLALMSDVVLGCSDDLMNVLEKDVLYWQTILVLLSNQKHERIRTSTFTLLKNFFLRCSPKYRHMFVSKQGFLILSNELKKSWVNSVVADALFSLTCGEHISIRDGLDSKHLEEIQYDSFKLASFYALYALLEESTRDSALFWSVCSSLQKIFVSDNAPRRAMFESGLISTLSNVVWKLCFSGTSPPVDSPMFSLIDCWISFAQSVIAYVIPYKNTENYSACEDFLWLCIVAGYQCDSYMSFRSGDVHNISNMSRIEVDFDMAVNRDLNWADRPMLELGVKTLRKALCQIIYCWIDTIQTILSDQFQTFSKKAHKNVVSISSMEESDFELIAEEDLEHSWLSPASNVERIRSKEFALSEDMANRLLFGLNMAQNFFFFLSTPQRSSDHEETLFRYCIEIVLSTYKRKQNEKLNDDWQSVLIMCREKARSILAELIAFVFYPANDKMIWLLKSAELSSQEEKERKPELDDDLANVDEENLPWPLKRRLIIARQLAKETHQDRYYLESLLDVNLDYQYGMKITLHELALLPNIVKKYNIEEYNAEIELLVKFLSRIQIESPLGKLSREEVNSTISDEVLLLHSYCTRKKEFCNQISTRAFMICETDNALNKITTDTAMTLTCEIAEFQNNPRRTFIFWRKDFMNDLARAGNTLENFIRELCHPEAAFFNSNVWPIGRTLETTESPGRERRRLTPCHYQFPLKFLQKPQRALAEQLNFARSPLYNILSFKEHKSLEHAEAITQVRLSISATLLRTAFECYGEIVVSDTKLYFLGEQAKSTQKGVSYSPVTYSFAYERIREIHERTYMHKETALELFIMSGDAFLIIFGSSKERQALSDQLVQMNLSHLLVDYKSQLVAATEKWRKNGITNFDYIMLLNKLSGRSFNDLMQYPVFPFVLSNYSQKSLDLNTPLSYRDLSKPMAIQNPEMEDIYARSYNNLQEEHEKADEETFSSARFGPYHYGSHYSNTGIVAYYLVRVPPYTSVALEYQDNNFDIADRLFNSLETTWRLSSSESTTDFKELIPEFFFFPEMFQNREHLALGVRQVGDTVEDVHLPPWCPRANNGQSPNGDPRIFCLIHRQALESTVVTNSLHLWIDLMFGFKQHGESALKSMNVFHPMTYRGRDWEAECNDELTMNAIRTMVRTYGQMPLTLFQSPHLPHMNLRKSSMSNIPASLATLASTNAREDVSYPNHIFRTVEGLRWGEFYGSPEYNSKYYQTPSYTFEVDRSEKVNKLKIVIEKDQSQSCYGTPAATELITYYKLDKRDALRRTLEPVVSAILSWRFLDNVLRIKILHKNENCWINLIDMHSLELMSVAFSSNDELLFLGFKCGLIRVYSLTYRNESVSFHRKWTINLRSELFAHEFPISSIQVSDDFHVVVTTSTDGKICVWDMNSKSECFRLEFINLLVPPPSPNGVDEVVKMCCISSTTADVCVCLQSGRGSRIVLFTINGDVVAVHKEEETITSMAMTNIPEGLGINCVAIGFANGHIRLLDTWTLNVVYVLAYRGVTETINCLAFANESRRLYASVGGIRILGLQVPSASGLKSPVFRALNPFS